MTWVPVVTDSFNRANSSAGAAGSNTGVGNGWVDNYGTVWSIASQKLLGTTSIIGGYLSQQLVRPSNEATVDQRIVATLTGGATDGNDGTIYARVSLCIRYQGSNNYYLIEVGPTLDIFAITGGATANSLNQTTYPGLISGHSYTLDFSAVGSNPTTVTFILTDSTASASYTVTTSDSTSVVQGPGTAGFVVWYEGSSPPASVNYTSGNTYYNSVASPTPTPTPTTPTPTPTTGISVSPSSIVGSVASQVFAVSGTGTSFSGTPFSLSGGLWPVIRTQSVSNGTTASVTITPGLAGNGSLTLTDNNSGFTTVIPVVSPSLGTIKIGWIGDSITYGTFGDPVTQAGVYLTTLGYTVTSVNQGQPGATTNHWLPGGSYMTAALSAFATAGVTIVHIMLGTNDIRVPYNYTPAVVHANMILIVQLLVSHGYQVVISRSPFTIPDANWTHWPSDLAPYYQQIFALNLQLVDGISVFQGDSGIATLSALNPTTFLNSDGIHPANTTQNNILGNYWGSAIYQRFGVNTQRWTHF